MVNGKPQAADHSYEMGCHTLYETVVTGTRSGVTTVDGEINPCIRINHKQHHHAEIEETEHGAPIHIDVSEQHCTKAQEAVQNRDPCEIACRYEMTYPFLFRRVIDANGNRHDGHVMPRGENQQFQFRFITAGKDIQSVQTMQGYSRNPVCVSGRLMVVWSRNQKFENLLANLLFP